VTDRMDTQGALPSPVDVHRMPPEPPGLQGPVVAEPLWRIRLRLAARSFRSNWKLFRRNPIGLLGLGIIALFALMAIAHPILMATVWDPAIYDPVRGYDAPVTELLVVEEVTDPTTEIDLPSAQLATNPFVRLGDTIQIPLQPAPPSSSHLLGTDPLGRDIFSQLLYSTRSAFMLGAIAALVTVFIATSVGAIAAYYGGWLDSALMRFADLILLLPLIPTLIVVSALFTLNLPLLGLLIGILSGFGGTAIILKSQALAVKVKPFIDAARVAGGSHRHIILRHIIPNVLPLSFLYMMFTCHRCDHARGDAVLPGPAADPDELGHHDQHCQQPGLPAQRHLLLVVAVPRRHGRDAPGRRLLPGRPGDGRGRQPQAAGALTA
jgi:peptide/nickel transport system permease protein